MVAPETTEISGAMQTEPNMESPPKGESKAARTAFIAVLMGAPGLLLTAFAAANSPP
jgi:hypothetical protein